MKQSTDSTKAIVIDSLKILSLIFFIPLIIFCIKLFFTIVAVVVVWWLTHGLWYTKEQRDIAFNVYRIRKLINSWEGDI